MSIGYNKGKKRFSLIGNLGKDVELAESKSGTSYCFITLAVNGSVKKGEEWEDSTDWFSLVAYGKIAENFAKYAKQGLKYCLEGEMRQKTEDKEGNRVFNCYNLIMDTYVPLSPKGEGGDDSGSKKSKKSSKSKKETPQPIEDEEW